MWAVKRSQQVRQSLLVLADVAAILVFVAIGRAVHADGVSLSGMVSTSWPFLAGAGLGWLGSRAWRRPAALLRVGVPVWLACVAIGMVLRVLGGQGTAVAFILVALGFLGATILGWRLVVAILRLPRFLSIAAFSRARHLMT